MSEETPPPTVKEVENVKIDLIFDELTKIKHLLLIAVKSKNTNSYELIETELRKRPRQGLSVSELRRLLGRSRQWTLELMERASQFNPHIKRIPGDKQMQRGTRLIWMDDADFRNFDTLKAMVERSPNGVSLRAVKDKFGFETVVAYQLMNFLCESNPDYFVYSEEYQGGRAKPMDDVKFIRKKTFKEGINSSEDYI